jgi:hypothetical protein
MSNQQYTSPRLADALLGSVAPLEVGWREPNSEQAEVCGALLGHLISDLFLNALMQSPVGTYHELRSGEESALFTAGRFPETAASWHIEVSRQDFDPLLPADGIDWSGKLSIRRYENGDLTKHLRYQIDPNFDTVTRHQLKDVEGDAMSENFVYPTELLNLTDLLMNQLTLALPELE